MQPGSQLSINAVEGFPLEDFSADVNSSQPLIGSQLGQTNSRYRPFDHKSLRRKRSLEVAEANRI